MIKKIAHVGIATRSIAVAMEFFKALGVEMEGIEMVEEQKVKVGFLKLGDTYIELIEATHQDSPIARFIEKRGEGFHHLTLEVDDIEADLRKLKEMDVKLVDAKPRRGAGGKLIAFIHPNSAGGVLIELSQAPTADAAKVEARQSGPGRRKRR